MAKDYKFIKSEVWLHKSYTGYALADLVPSRDGVKTNYGRGRLLGVKQTIATVCDSHLKLNELDAPLLGTTQPRHYFL